MSKFYFWNQKKKNGACVGSICYLWYIKDVPHMIVSLNTFAVL